MLLSVPGVCLNVAGAALIIVATDPPPVIATRVPGVPMCANGTTVVTPCGHEADTLFVGQSAATAFALTNGGNAGASYTAECSYAPPVSTCNVDRATISVDGASAGSVVVSYTAGSEPGVGDIALLVSAGGVPIVSVPVTVTVVARPGASRQPTN